MKAAPTAAIIRILNSEGLGIDASSGFEVERAVRAGVGTESISLSTQEFPDEFRYWIQDGVKTNLFAPFIKSISSDNGEKVNSSASASIPRLGSGGTNRTNAGGPASSFGIWKDDLEKAKSLCRDYDLTVERIHTHIGSGSDPEVWKKVAAMSLDLVRAFPTVHTLNLGGGYKVARMSDEKATDLREIGEPVKQLFEDFAQETGRELKLEIEPGTFLFGQCL